MRPATPLAVFATLAAACPAARADDLDLRELDKQAHLAVGYGLTLTTAVIARRFDLPRWQAVAVGVAATAVLGTIKELVDPPYSWGDQLATTLGSGLAAGVVFTFRL